MDITINSTCNRIANSTRQDKSHEAGAFVWISRLASQFRYPDIRSDDNRVAEYIPPSEPASSKG